MNQEKRILWIGPVVIDNTLKGNNAISPAANAWQLGFFQGLNQNECFVNSLSYVPFPSWPKGPFFAKPHKVINTDSGFTQMSVGYLNLKYVREYWISFALFFKALTSSELLSSDVLFTYNPLRRHRIFANIYRRIYKKPWISILADDKIKDTPDHTLFLSYDYYLRAKINRKSFCDGGIQLRNIPPRELNLRTPKSLLYAGSLNKWTGISEFIEEFSKIDTQGFELNIYGKGNTEDLIQQLELLNLNNVFIHGFVSDDVLKRACEEAYAFVNPRNTDLINNENNFPSKLLLYLSFKKPVISAHSKGLAKVYDDFLLYYNYANELKDQLTLISDINSYNECATKIEQFVAQNTWEQKVKKQLEIIYE